MDYCNVSGCYKGIKYLLFTSYSCTHCLHVKEELGNLIKSGLITNVDLMKGPSRELVSIFKRISPSENIPALALLDQDGKIIIDRKTGNPISFVGVDSVLSLFNKK